MAVVRLARKVWLVTMPMDRAEEGASLQPHIYLESLVHLLSKFFRPKSPNLSSDPPTTHTQALGAGLDAKSYFLIDVIPKKLRRHEGVERLVDTLTGRSVVYQNLASHK